MTCRPARRKGSSASGSSASAHGCAKVTPITRPPARDRADRGRAPRATRARAPPFRCRRTPSASPRRTAPPPGATAHSGHAPKEAVEVLAEHSAAGGFVERAVQRLQRRLPALSLVTRAGRRIDHPQRAGERSAGAREKRQPQIRIHEVERDGGKARGIQSKSRSHGCRGQRWRPGVGTHLFQPFPRSHVLGREGPRREQELGHVMEGGPSRGRERDSQRGQRARTDLGGGIEDLVVEVELVPRPPARSAPASGHVDELEPVRDAPRFRQTIRIEGRGAIGLEHDTARQGIADDIAE